MDRRCHRLVATVRRLTGWVRLTGWARANRAAIVLVLLVAVLTGASLVQNARAVTSDDHKWCAAMMLLTEHPVPKPADPKANPSREQTYRFYETFVTLKRSLGC